jgi:hypothetical protein
MTPAVHVEVEATAMGVVQATDVVVAARASE